MKIINGYSEIYTDVLVIGSGGAVMKAALSAYKEGVKVLIVSKGKFGDAFLLKPVRTL